MGYGKLVDALQTPSLIHRLRGSSFQFSRHSPLHIYIYTQLSARRADGDEGMACWRAPHFFLRFALNVLKNYSLAAARLGRCSATLEDLRLPRRAGQLELAVGRDGVPKLPVLVGDSRCFARFTWTWFGAAATCGRSCRCSSQRSASSPARPEVESDLRKATSYYC